MKFRTLLRHFRDGFKNVLRNGWMTFASVSSIVVSLFILGVFLLVALNVNSMADQIESQVEIRVYLQLDVDEAKRAEIEETIRNMPEVSKVTFVTKEEGLEQLRESLGEENKDLFEGYDNENNPLMDSYTVDIFDPQKISEVADQISAINDNDETQPIMDVNYGKGTIETLFKITNAVRNIGLIMVLGLIVTAMFLIANTIKTTIVARRREISIMKLVGATNSFIRWPFFIEGALIGLIGSVITTGLLLWGYSELVRLTQVDLGLMLVKLVTLKESGTLVATLLIGLGVLIGVWGSTLSIRKYLKV